MSSWSADDCAQVAHASRYRSIVESKLLMYEDVSVASLSGMDWGGRYGNEALSGEGGEATSASSCGA